MQKTLSIDIETYSSEDLTKSGVYRYAEAPDFSILLFGYAFNDEPVHVVDLACGNELPKEVLDALLNASVLKTAWNAAFEITCISSHFNIDLDVTQWECSMVKSAMLGLPLSLDMASKVLQLPEEKMKAGKALIRYFSLPCKATKANQGRTRNLPHHDPDKWNLYKEYNGMDVEVERAIRSKIAFFEIPEQEKQLWYLDQKINRKGVLLDMQLVNNAIEIDNLYKYELEKEAKDITGLDNPNSPLQLKTWLSKELNVERKRLWKDERPDFSKHENPAYAEWSYEASHQNDGPEYEEVISLTKADVSSMLAYDTLTENAKRVLELRQEMSKTSVKKYQAMYNTVCKDGRVKGLFQFHGANRTGRWAGRLVQMQNLPKNHLDDLDLARDLVKDNELDILKLTFGNVPDTLSQLIRTAFIASEGNTLYVADFSAIEARVIAWWAKEKWRLDVFNTHGKIYEASAAAMFGVPLSSVTKGSDLRQKGKVAELALGYQGGLIALLAMGALEMGLTEDELPALVTAWRRSNKNIVQLWYATEAAAKDTIKTGNPNSVSGVTFYMRKGILFMGLPSGRSLAYLKPRVLEKQTKVGIKEAIQFEGMNQTTKQWGVQDTYGGKLVENAVQAIARDCLADKMLLLDRAGYDIVLHVHDEGGIDAPRNPETLNAICELMGQPISWAPGLPLRADGYITDFYKKD